MKNLLRRCHIYRITLLGYQRPYRWRIRSEINCIDKMHRTNVAPRDMATPPATEKRSAKFCVTYTIRFVRSVSRYFVSMETLFSILLAASGAIRNGGETATACHSTTSNGAGTWCKKFHWRLHQSNCTWVWLLTGDRQAASHAKNTNWNNFRCTSQRLIVLLQFRI